MSLAAGTRLGVYEILGPLGAGGMGEVFKARDARLERTVAVKILPPHLATDPTLIQRFEREAKTLATLSHPHICVVFDIGSAPTAHGEINFLVMEYLEGETLAHRLTRRALPVDEALRYAIQIADALEQAHRKKVIHRDLKPGNIMLTASGLKLLDFGLAKTNLANVGDDDLTASPTVTSPLTSAGMIIGTFQYMAPEQLEGREADVRSDVFAFGAVMYEMLTGHKAFEGESQARVVAAILEREPQPVSALQPTAPHALDQLVKTCLAKNPEIRWQSAGDIRRQLTWILDEVSQSGTTTPVRPSRFLSGRTWVVPVATTVAVAALTFAVWTMTRSAPSPALEVSRLLLAPSPNARMISVSGLDVLISPDGKRIVYLGAGRQGGQVLYVRELDSLESRAITGTELPENFPAANPFFTADGESIFFRSPPTGIVRVPLRGGPPLKIANDAPVFLGGTAAGDVVVLALGDGLYRTSPTGGQLERLTEPDAEPMFYFAPSMLPNGRAILFQKRSARQLVNDVLVLDLQTRQQHLLVNDGANPYYLPSGHLVFARGTTLMAAAFDVERVSLTGNIVAVQEGVQRPPGLGASDYSVSANGTLIYVPAAPGSTDAVTPVWVDRNGREIGPATGTPIPDLLSSFANLGISNSSSFDLSPDGQRLVVAVGRSGDLWVYDLTGRPPFRLVTNGINIAPLWHPDGSRVAFSSNRDGPFAMFSVASDGSTLEPTRIDPRGAARTSPLPSRLPETWLPDGRLVFTDTPMVGDRADLLVAAGTQGGKLDVLVQTEFTEDSARVSPDGRWLAYRSDRTGRLEIWVRAVSGGAPLRVSQNGGDWPVWARNSRELFYREGNKMMVVGTKGGTARSFDPAVQLFEHSYGATYAVAPDGRFLMIPQPQPGNPTSPGAIVVVQNWTQELKRLVR